MRPRVNVELLHEKWLGDLARHCRDVLCKETAEALVLSDFHEDNDADFLVVGRVSLPRDTALFIDYMNRSCRSALSSPSHVYEIAQSRTPTFPEIEEFPETTYCLHSLLASAYPRDLSAQRFRANTCGIKLLCMDIVEQLSDEERSHLAFGGLGTILIRECRAVLGTSDDEETMQKSKGHWLVFQ